MSKPDLELKKTDMGKSLRLGVKTPPAQFLLASSPNGPLSAGKLRLKYTENNVLAAIHAVAEAGLEWAASAAIQADLDDWRGERVQQSGIAKGRIKPSSAFDLITVLNTNTLEDEPLWPGQKEMAQFAINGKQTILGDRMGLGKTRAALAAVAIDAANQPGNVGRHLAIVSHAGLKDYWRRELDAMKHNGLVVSRFFDTITSISWGKLSRVREIDKDQPLTYVIVDEAHKAKNRNSQRSKILMKICNMKSIKLIVLATGSAIADKPQDLWHLLHILDPKNYSSYWEFVRSHCEIDVVRYGQKEFHEIGRPINQKRLGKRISNRLISRDYPKDALPPKHEKFEDIAISQEIKNIYKRIRKEPFVEVNGEIYATDTAIGKSHWGSTILGMDPNLTNRALELIDDNRGHTIIVFEHVLCAESFYDKLREQHPINDIYTGWSGHNQIHLFEENTAPGQQKSVWDRTDSTGGKVLICTYGSAAEGYNLQTANLMLLAEPTYSYYTFEQMQRRVHRSGQKNPVTEIKLVPEKSLHTSMWLVTMRKGDWVEDLRQRIADEQENFALDAAWGGKI